MKQQKETHSTEGLDLHCHGRFIRTISYHDMVQFPHTSQLASCYCTNHPTRWKGNNPSTIVGNPVDHGACVKAHVRILLVPAHTSEVRRTVRDD